MKEQVGNCSICGTPIYCNGGFLNGIVTNEGELNCFECGNGNKVERFPTYNRNSPPARTFVES